MNKDKKLQKYLRKQVMKCYFTWSERLYLWFKGIFKKREVTPEGLIGDVWAKHIKHHSDLLIKKINKELMSKHRVKLKLEEK